MEIVAIDRSVHVISGAASSAAKSDVQVGLSDAWETAVEQARHLDGIVGAPMGNAGTSGAATVSDGATAGNRNSLVKFEAFILQNFFDAMLPRNSDVLFGEGFAGDTWRGVLAENLATHVAKAGGVGIAAMVSGESSAGHLGTLVTSE